MRAAITRRHVVLGGVIASLIGVFGCVRGSSLLDPSNAEGFRPPTPEVSAITLAPASVGGTIGGQAKVWAAPVGPSGEPISAGAVAWVSSDPKVATVSGSGMVTFVHRGNAVITAIADGVTASVAADVEAAPPASIEVTPDSTLIQTGQQVQLGAIPLLATGAIDSGVVVDWSSSNSGVASVSSGGVVTAIAVGVATITASSGGVNGAATIKVTSSTLVVSTVSVSPPSSSLYPSQSEQLSVVLRDAAGEVLSGIPVSWSSSNPAAASVSSSGLVTGVANGSTEITASAGGQSGMASVAVATPVVASVSVNPSAVSLSPGETTPFTATAFDASGIPISVSVSWTTSDAGVASISSSGIVTANAIGSAIITANAGGVSGSGAVSVESGPPGGFNEPPGMSMQINTGAMSSIPGSFTIFSPSTPSSAGEWSGNLTVVPAGTGLRITYPTNVQGGTSPVRFGSGVKSPGTGWYYQRMRVRFSPNWTLNGDVAMKFCEPRSQQTGSGQGANENEVIGAHDFATQSIHAWLYVLEQGPNGHFRNLFEQPSETPVANLNDGNWHWIEVVWGPESSPGAGNGSYSAWVDGKQIARYTNVGWLAPGNQVGWPYLMFDPTYGGGTHSPPRTIYWDFDQLYVSTR